MANILTILKMHNKRAKKNKMFFVLFGIIFVFFLFPLVSKSSGGPLSVHKINLSNGRWFIKGTMQGLTIEEVPYLSKSEQFIALLLNSTSLLLVMFSYGFKIFDDFYFEEIIMKNAKVLPFVFPPIISLHPAFLFILNYITNYKTSLPVIIFSYFIGKYIISPLINSLLFSLRNLLASLFYRIAEKLELKAS